ncbi:MAG: hypothetical protein DMG38_28770 [Acidobacteria bacterium]|nr:MAG: hypothetical protein DMG38_28770 [Acidobacteriota bacterium]
MKACASSWLRFPAFALPAARFALLTTLLSAVLLAPPFKTTARFFLTRAQAPPTPAIKVVNLIPASLSGESNQDSEPFLAIQSENPQVMVASAFTPNPFSMTGNAPVYVSQDGGKSWALNAITPVQHMTCDITHAMATGENHPRGDLHAGTLACASGITLDESESNDVALGATMNVQSTRGNVDQPFVRALGVSSGDRIYVGVNDFNQANGHTATIDVSVNGGATYRSIPIEMRNTAGQDGPSVRPAVANDGTVYAAFFGWRKFNGKTATSDVVVVRDDAAATGANPFRALKDPTDKLPGLLVVKKVAIPWSNAPALGQERIGSTLSIAVDPNHSGTVYVGWADKGSKGDIYTLHVRRSTDRGVTWSKTDLPHTTIHNATNVALAVANNGAVGFLYQQLSRGRWVTHLVQSHDGFMTSQDFVLATVPADQPVGQFLPYLGDYDYLLSVGNEFRGVFCANNAPDFANFPQGVTYQRAADFSAKTLNDGAGIAVPISIDPFYFSVPVIP